MRIKEVLYCNKGLGNFARKIGEEFDANFRYYKPHNPTLVKWGFYGRRGEHILPDTVLLGFNNYHHYDTFLSCGTIVVVDRHIDFYKTKLYRQLGIITEADWIVWRLKLDEGDVHLVVPDLHLFKPSFFVTVEKFRKRFHFYSPQTFESLQYYVAEWRNLLSEIKPPEQLSKIDGDVDHLNIDLDMLKAGTEDERKRIQDSIPKPRTCSLRIDPYQYLPTQYEVCLDILKKIQD